MKSSFENSFDSLSDQKKMLRINIKLVVLFCVLIGLLLITYMFFNTTQSNSVDDKTSDYESIRKSLNDIQSSLPDQVIVDYREHLTQKEVYKSLLKSPNDVVLRYVPLPYDYRYGSNAIPLTVAALIADGPILELGMGKFSTPLLHMIGADQGRQVISVETNHDWMLKFVAYNSTKYHKIYHLKNMEAMSRFGLNLKWGMVLTDHVDAAQRPLDIINFSKRSKVIVAHDTERPAEKGYEFEKNNVGSYFKYKCKYSFFDSHNKTYYTSTSIFSNEVDLSFLEDLFSKVTTEYGHVACDYNM